MLFSNSLRIWLIAEIHADKEETKMWEEAVLLEMVLKNAVSSRQEVEALVVVASDLPTSNVQLSQISKTPLWNKLPLTNINLQWEVREQLLTWIDLTTAREAICTIEVYLEAVDETKWFKELINIVMLIYYYVNI